MLEVRITVTLGGVYSLMGVYGTLPGVGNVLYLEFSNSYVGIYICKKIIEFYT